MRPSTSACSYRGRTQKAQAESMSRQKTETSELLLAKKLVRLLPGVARAPTDEEGNSRKCPKCPREVSASVEWVRPAFAVITLLSNVQASCMPLGMACGHAAGRVASGQRHVGV